MAYHIAFWIDCKNINPFEVRDAMTLAAMRLGAKVDSSDPQSEEHEFPDEESDDDGQPSEQQEWEDVEGREFYTDLGDD